MATTNIFEIAAIHKFRYPFKGMISTEQLWDLRKEDIDSIYRTLNVRLQDKTTTKGLAETNDEEDAEVIELRVKMQILRHVYNYKVEEEKNRDREIMRAERRRQLVDLLAEKEDDELREKSKEEIRRMIEEL